MFSKPVKAQKSDLKSCHFVESMKKKTSIDILHKFHYILCKAQVLLMGENKILWDGGVILVISKHFRISSSLKESEFQMFEPNFEFGAVNE